jgi:hypothetical protein
MYDALPSLCYHSRANEISPLSRSAVLNRPTGVEHVQSLSKTAKDVPDEALWELSSTVVIRALACKIPSYLRLSVLRIQVEQALVRSPVQVDIT